MSSPRSAPTVAIVLLAALCAGCGAQDRGQYVLRGSLLGSQYHVTIVGERQLDRLGHREISQQLQTRLAEIVVKTDLELPFSEVNRLNESPAGVPVPVSTDILELLQLAKGVAQQTGGAFDVTIGPLKAAWGVTSEPPKLRVPEPDELRSVLRRCGLGKIEVRESESEIVKEDSAVTLDLSNVVDGYATDQLAETLEELGWTDYIVQVGEEVRTRGSDRLGRPWRISIQRGLGAGAGGVIPISDHAIAVEGNDAWLEGEDGQLYSQYIDPRSGRPVNHSLLSATVVCARGSEADAYAQALMVLGHEEGLRFASDHNLAALLLVQSEGRIEEVASPGFERVEKPPTVANARRPFATARLRVGGR